MTLIVRQCCQITALTESIAFATEWVNSQKVLTEAWREWKASIKTKPRGFNLRNPVQWHPVFPPTHYV
ncbi:hypothetical protein O9992_12195 [Vibrio lentus]|nr:hypothetical protein [Vibrio lentus]